MAWCGCRKAPGLGLTLDREALERLTRLPRQEPQRWIIKSRFENGTKLYGLVDPRKPHVSWSDRDLSRLLPMRYAEPITTEYWDDDGTPEYAAMIGRLDKEGVVLEA